MGILTSPKQARGLFKLVAKYENRLSVLLYVAGIIWMLALAYTPFNAPTYFSENALLPALVERHYNGQKDAAKFAEKALEKLHTLSQNQDTIDLSSKLPVSWLEKQFRQLGLEAYSQNFTVDHPFLETFGRELKGPTRLIRGNNVYGILRAPRSDGTEAVVMSVPFRTGDEEQVYGATSHGVGLMLSLAKFFRKYTYWSKDVIFLVTEHEELGMQAWLDSYYHMTSQYITSSLMAGRSGALIGAVNLELGSERPDFLDIQMEGVNGQLPNLDLINTAVRLCRRERVPVTVQQRMDPSPREAETLAGYRGNLGTLLLAMARQASGKPSSVHGLFHRYHVEAITLRGVNQPTTRARNTLTYTSLGRVLEGIFRSLNNLLERFHQSFFFYLMPGTERYISIGLYMPPFGLLASIPVVKALALWFAMFPPKESGSQTSDDSKQEKSDEGEAESEGQEKVQEVKEGEPEDTNTTEVLSLVSVVPTLLLVVFPGVMNYISPTHAMRWCRIFGVHPESAIAVGCVAFFGGAIFIPIWFKRSLPMRGQVAGDWRLLKFLGLLFQAMTLTAVAMLNFSLGFLLATTTIPIYALLHPHTSRMRSALQMLLMLLVHPPVLLFLCLSLFIGVTGAPDGPAQLLDWSLLLWQRALFTTVLDYHLFGNWMFALCTLVLFPNWLLFWTIIFRSKPDPSG